MLTIEFIGGPYDGYRQRVTFTAERLQPFVPLPMSRAVLFVIAFDEPCELEPVIDEAVYCCLERTESCARYSFIGMREATSDWTRWCRLTVEAWERQFGV